MKSVKCLVFLAAITASATAFGQAVPPVPPPPPPAPPASAPLCVDDDRDGHFAAVPCTMANGHVTGSNAKFDCDDHNSAIKPGGVEVAGNAFDEDCDGTVNPFVADSYAKFGCSKTDLGCQKRIDAEIVTCTAAGAANCTVSWSTGTLILRNGYKRCHTCAGFKIMSPAAYDTYQQELKDGQHQCRPAATPRCDPSTGTGCSNNPRPRPSGTRRATVAPPRDDKKLDEEIAARIKGDKALDGRLGKAEDLLGDVDARTVELEDGLAAEIARATAAEEALGFRVDGVEDTANRGLSLAEQAGRLALQADGKASIALKSGVELGLDVGLGFKAQNAITLKGDGTARGSVAPALMVNLHIGGETSSAIYRLIGGIGLPFEEGPDDSADAGFMWTVGAQSLWKVSPTVALGITGRYLDHESGGSVIGTNARSRGGSGGFALQFAPEVAVGGFRFNAITFTAEMGGESLGTKGETNEVLASGLYGLFTLSTGIGYGPSER